MGGRRFLTQTGWAAGEPASGNQLPTPRSRAVRTTPLRHSVLTGCAVCGWRAGGRGPCPRAAAGAPPPDPACVVGRAMCIRSNNEGRSYVGMERTSLSHSHVQLARQDGSSGTHIPQPHTLACNLHVHSAAWARDSSSPFWGLEMLPTHRSMPGSLSNKPSFVVMSNPTPSTQPLASFGGLRSPVDAQLLGEEVVLIVLRLVTLQPPAAPHLDLRSQDVVGAAGGGVGRARYMARRRQAWTQGGIAWSRRAWQGGGMA